MNRPTRFSIALYIDADDLQLEIEAYLECHGTRLHPEHRSALTTQMEALEADRRTLGRVTTETDPEMRMAAATRLAETIAEARRVLTGVRWALEA